MVIYEAEVGTVAITSPAEYAAPETSYAAVAVATPVAADAATPRRPRPVPVAVIGTMPPRRAASPRARVPWSASGCTPAVACGDTHDRGAGNVPKPTRCFSRAHAKARDAASRRTSTDVARDARRSIDAALDWTRGRGCGTDVSRPSGRPLADRCDDGARAVPATDGASDWDEALGCGGTAPPPWPTLPARLPALPTAHGSATTEGPADGCATATGTTSGAVRRFAGAEAARPAGPMVGTRAGPASGAGAGAGGWEVECTFGCACGWGARRE